MNRTGNWKYRKYIKQLSKKVGIAPKRNWIMQLYWNNQKHFSNVRVFHSFHKNGKKIFQKWMYLREMAINSDPKQWKYFRKCNHRTIFPFEIVLDLDPDDYPKNVTMVEALRQAIYKLKKITDCSGNDFAVYFTGSRGYHIHLYIPKLADYSRRKRERFREVILRQVQHGENLKKSDQSGVAIENISHHKTGNKKRLIAGQETAKLYLEEGLWENIYKKDYKKEMEI